MRRASPAIILAVLCVSCDSPTLPPVPPVPRAVQPVDRATIAIAPPVAHRSTAPPLGGTGSVCLAPVMDPSEGDRGLANPSAGNPVPAYTVQFDNQDPVSVPHAPNGEGPGVLITGVPMDDSHLVRIRHQGKPIESFRFRFAAEDDGRLCLWMKELYLTWSLWPVSNGLPQCRCTAAPRAEWQPTHPHSRQPGR